MDNQHLPAPQQRRSKAGSGIIGGKRGFYAIAGDTSGLSSLSRISRNNSFARSRETPGSGLGLGTTGRNLDDKQEDSRRNLAIHCNACLRKKYKVDLK